MKNVVVTRHPRLIWVMIFCAILGGTLGYLICRPSRLADVSSIRTPVGIVFSVTSRNPVRTPRPSTVGFLGARPSRPLCYS